MSEYELSAQDKIEEYKRELAAEGKTFDTVASDKLEKDLARMGVESSQIQDQYKIRQREGFPGFGFERQPQQTLSQILQKQEPPPAFFEGIPQAMQEAIARVNQQIVSEEPFVSPNVGRDVETRPLPGFQAEEGPGVLPRNENRDGFPQEEFRKNVYQQQEEENVSKANEQDVTDFTGIIANLASNEELSNSQRSALNRLSTELNQRAEMGRQVTEEDLKNLQNDERYRSAFNVVQNIAEDDPKILENVLGGLEVLQGIPFFAPAGRLAQLARVGRVSLKETPGRPLRAVVEGVKVRSATPRELKEGIAGVAVRAGGKTKTLVPVGTRASSRPPNTSLGRKTPIFMIPPADYTPDKIENVKQLQTETLNFIIAREGFKPKPYDDIEQTSIGFGTKVEEGQQSITKQEAVEAAQEYLVNNVYPEIDFIQENGTRGLTENQITAVSSLIYNVGLPKWLNSKSRQLLLDGKFEEFKKEAFTGPNAFLTREPKFLAGLKNRREIEAKLFDTPYVPLG